MLCPSCNRRDLPAHHVPGRDAYGRPLCDDCFDAQLRASAISRRILDDVAREHRATITTSILHQTHAGIQASRSKRGLA